MIDDTVAIALPPMTDERPTMALRFVRRTASFTHGGQNYISEKTVLQQCWTITEHASDGRFNSWTEWRDVPLEAEEA